MVTRLSYRARTSIVIAFAALVYSAAVFGAHTIGSARADEEMITTSAPAFAQDTASPAFYQDTRYLILIADALIVLGLSMALVFRLINRYFPGTPALPGEPGGPKAPTVDQLKIDIPL